MKIVQEGRSHRVYQNAAGEFIESRMRIRTHTQVMFTEIGEEIPDEIAEVAARASVEGLAAYFAGNEDDEPVGEISHRVESNPHYESIEDEENPGEYIDGDQIGVLHTFRVEQAYWPAMHEKEQD